MGSRKSTNKGGLQTKNNVNLQTAFLGADRESLGLQPGGREKEEMTRISKGGTQKRIEVGSHANRRVWETSAQGGMMGLGSKLKDLSCGEWGEGRGWG